MTEAPPIKPRLRPGKPIATFNVPDPWQEYGGNALQADSKYKGKALKVKGAVAAVQADENGR